MHPLSSPARRALGNKDPNAPLHVVSPDRSKNAFQSPESRARPALSKEPVSPPKPTANGPRVGQKRTIDQVDSSMSQESQAVPGLSQMTNIMSDGSLELEETSNASLPRTKSTPNTTFTAFPPSQEAPSQVEHEFEIHEEPSQRTLDQMHAVQLPQNHSQMVPLRPSLVEEASQHSLSMSSLIDFENNRSSQSGESQLAEVRDHHREPSPLSEEESRRQLMREKAATLRTRLQLAFFKVETNQISRPFARLQVPRTRSTSPERRFASSSPTSSSTLRPSSLRGSVMTPESRVAIARARATMGPKPAVKALYSLPVPRIMPTAYSARWNPARVDPADTPDPALIIPSSPPLSHGEQTPPSHGHHTVRCHGAAPPRTPVQLSSPASIAGDPNDARRRGNLGHRVTGYGDLTSSVVKGEAANSLLELVRGGITSTGGVGMCGV